MPVAEGATSVQGSAVDEEHRFQLGDGETDPDLIDAIKALLGGGGPEGRDRRELAAWHPEVLTLT